MSCGCNKSNGLVFTRLGGGDLRIHQSKITPDVEFKSNFQRVREWNKAIGKDCPTVPTVPSLDMIKLAIGLIQEELDELKEACGMTQLTDEQLEQVEQNACESGNLNDAFEAGRMSLNWSQPDLTKVNLVEVADALADLEVVIFGASSFFGINQDETFGEVMRSNDTKLIDGFKRPSDGKWMKGPSYVPPDLESVVDRLKTEPME